MILSKAVRWWTFLIAKGFIILKHIAPDNVRRVFILFKAWDMWLTAACHGRSWHLLLTQICFSNTITVHRIGYACKILLQSNYLEIFLENYTQFLNPKSIWNAQKYNEYLYTCFSTQILGYLFPLRIIHPENDWDDLI